MQYIGWIAEDNGYLSISIPAAQMYLADVRTLLAELHTAEEKLVRAEQIMHERRLQAIREGRQ